MPVPRPPVQVDLRPYFKGEEKGHATKTLIVLHETVSYNKLGVMDIVNPAKFLDEHGLEIHGIVDAEANSGWCYDAKAVYDHAASGKGNINTRSVGFELVSEIPLLPSPVRFPAWWRRKKQLNRVAWWCAWLHATEGIPLKYSDSTEPGITTHWDVSKAWLGGHGHWDCWPKHKGGHFPVLYVVQKARNLLDRFEAD